MMLAAWEALIKTHSNKINISKSIHIYVCTSLFVCVSAVEMPVKIFAASLYIHTLICGNNFIFYFVTYSLTADFT